MVFNVLMVYSYSQWNYPVLQLLVVAYQREKGKGRTAHKISRFEFCVGSVIDSETQPRSVIGICVGPVNRLLYVFIIIVSIHVY